MVDQLKKRSIKAYAHKEYVICEFNRVKLGNETEGYIIYNKIIVILKRLAIHGYMIRFHEFDYSSYWNTDVLLHPHLQLKSYGKVFELGKFARELKKMVRKYDQENNLISVSKIIDTFQAKRMTYGSMKFFVRDRTELSKKLFNKDK